MSSKAKNKRPVEEARRMEKREEREREGERKRKREKKEEKKKERKNSKRRRSCRGCARSPLLSNIMEKGCAAFILGTLFFFSQTKT